MEGRYNLLHFLLLLFLLLLFLLFKEPSLGNSLPKELLPSSSSYFSLPQAFARLLSTMDPKKRTFFLPISLHPPSNPPMFSLVSTSHSPWCSLLLSSPPPLSLPPLPAFRTLNSWSKPSPRDSICKECGPTGPKNLPKEETSLPCTLQAPRAEANQLLWELTNRYADGVSCCHGEFFKLWGHFHPHCQPS